MKLDEKLVLLRKENGVTQMELAEELAVSRQTISKWESGMVMPSPDNLKRLSDLYGVPVDYLLNDESERPSQTKEIKEEEGGETKSRRRKWLARIAYIVVLIVTAVVCILVTYHVTKNSIITPIEDLEAVPAADDGYPEVSFSIR